MPVSQAQAPSIGVVTGLTGEAFAESSSGVRALEPGSPIYQGEELVTGADGNIEVRFSDDTLLSQGSDSRIALDDYAYDPGNESGSELFVDMAQGTFRLVTGKIAETNPDKFKVGSPLATIGIRGTTTVHEIIPGNGEKHGVEQIHSGKALLVQSNITGDIRQIGQSMGLVDVSSSGGLSQVRPLTMQEFNTFRQIAPSNIRQEQEIESGRDEQEKNANDNEDQIDEQPEEQGNGQNPDQEDVGPEGQDGQQADGQPQEQQNGIPQDVTPGGGDTPAGEVLDSVLFPNGGAINPGGDILPNQQEINGQKLAEPPKEGDKQELVQNDQSQRQSGEQPAEEETGKGNGQNTSGKSEEILIDETENTENNDATTPPENEDSDVGNDGNDDSDDNESQYPEGALVGDSGESNILTGTANNDSIYGQELSDTLTGLAGDDYLDGGTGAEDQVDFASYAEAEGSITATLGGTGTGTATGADGNDTLVNIEGLIGSDYADTLIGDDGSNRFEPLLSKDYHPDSPDDNKDYIDGKDGSDWIQFENLSKEYNVTVNLDSSSASIFDSNEVEQSRIEIRNIENVIGTSGNDIINGDSGKNTITGGKGEDALNGKGGNDFIQGNAGNDTISGGEGDDTIEGNGGNDFIDSGNGSNFIDGGSGEDSLSYEDYSDPVELVLSAAGEGTATHHASGLDTIVNIEKFKGSSGNDIFKGSSGSDTFDGSAGSDYIKGEAGDDYLIGGEGCDTLDGGNGEDWVSYGYTSSGVTLTLHQGTDGSAVIGSETDTLRYIENAEGSSGADKIYGSSADNILMGLAGDDTIKGGDGNDTLFGGEGSNKLKGEDGYDTVSYADLENNGVSIDIAANSVNHGSDTDTLLDSFDTFIGTDNNDTYTGASDADTFYGGDGDDTLIISDGNDYFDGGTGTDTVSFEQVDSAVTVNYTTGSATGPHDGGSFTVTGVENFIGTEYNDAFTGSSAGETFTGGGGNDAIDGRGGSDWVSYAYDTSYDGLTVKLASGYESGELSGETDTLKNIENVIGTSGDDTIIGSEEENHFKGSDGSDRLDGADGNDILEGGEGDNSIIGGDGCDTISFAGTSTGINIDLADGSGTASHDGYTDTFSSIEAVVGGSGHDSITASSGIIPDCPSSPNDTIQGAGGNDTITLVNGQKSLLVYEAGSEGGDNVFNFVSGEDSFLFKGEDFDSAADDNFAKISEEYDGTNSGISGTEACFVFDDTNDKLWYDCNGSESGGTTLIATLNGVNDMSADDISVVT